MITVALATLLAALVAGGIALPPRPPDAVARVPDEPDVVVLPDGVPTLQALAADLDGDGNRDLIRLVTRNARAVWIEAWTDGGGGWRLMTEPEPAVPGGGGQAEMAYVGRPVRLLLRRVDGRDRVTLVRQPDFTEAGDPDDPAGCCLLFDDLEISGNAIELVSVAEPDAVADAVHAIDLDADGTDELLASRSIAPGDDPTAPVEARVFRWADGRFGRPTATDLPVGSPGLPFALGDSDGLPGDEVGFIGTSGTFHLYRVGLGRADSLVTEDSGIVASDAIAVPLGGSRRGIAVLNPTLGVGVLSWPRGRPLIEPASTRPVEGGARLIGVVEVAGGSHLVVHSPDAGAVRVLSLPRLEPIPAGPIRPTEAAAMLADGPTPAYVGPLPGGLPDGGSAAIVAGRLVPSPFYVGPALPVGALPGSWPVGLVGRDRQQLAIQHGAVPRIDPAGGRLDAPVIDARSSVAIATLRQLASLEGDGGRYEPSTTGSIPLASGAVGVTDEGMVADVRAPPGSRVHLSGPDVDASDGPAVVGDNGALEVAIHPDGATSDTSASVTLTVATPAGHAYVSSWDLQLVTDAPQLRASTETPIGSSLVTIAGETAAYAEVEIAGTSVEVDGDGAFTAGVALPPWPTEVNIVARDPFGHETSLVVSGVGLFDYRALPWSPIALLLLGAIAVAFIARVPHPRVAPRPVGDDAVLEDLDPADRP